MPRIEVEGYGGYDVEEGRRLVRALETSGVDILHRCGGFARCTTCRVEFVTGEPTTMTVAERDKLVERDGLGRFRLSCQIECRQDMRVRPLMTLHTTEYDDPGPEPEERVTPEPEWIERPPSDAAG